MGLKDERQRNFQTMLMNYLFSAATAFSSLVKTICIRTPKNPVRSWKPRVVMMEFYVQHAKNQAQLHVSETFDALAELLQVTVLFCRSSPLSPTTTTAPTSMQSRQNVWRSACKAHNAYSPVLALRAAFGTSPSCQADDNTPVIQQTPTNKPLNIIRVDPKSSVGDNVVGNGENGKLSRSQRRAQGLMKSRKPGKKHNPPRGPAMLGSELRSKDLPLPKQDPKVEKGVDFVSHRYWKQHMAHVREESFRIQHSRWFDDKASTALERVKHFMDYDAKVVQPEPSTMDTPLPMPWARNEMGRRKDTVNSCLSNDIDNFAAWARPTPAEQRAREAVFKETEELIRSVLTTTTTGIELFGSEKNGIALPTSDIDIRIYDAEDPAMPHSRLLPRLRRICAAMYDSHKFMLATVRNSGHPILNCQHRESGIDIQIVAADDPTRQQAVVAKYIQEVPQLREVYFVVRTVLSMRGLVDVFTGGMGSYGTFVMVLAVLNRHMKHLKAIPRPHPNISSASQLIAFLEFYRKLDTRKHGVAVHPRLLFKKHEETTEALKAYSTSAEKRGDVVRAGQWELCATRPFQPYLLCLQDPANPLNDLGRKSHAFKHIHATLAYLNQALGAGCLALHKWKKVTKNEPGGLEPLLLPLVGRCHEVYYDRRRKLEMYGEKLEHGDASAEEKTEGRKLFRRVVHYGKD